MPSLVKPFFFSKFSSVFTFLYLSSLALIALWVLDNFISLLGVVARPNIVQSRRESLFIQLLEGLSASEANLVVQAKDKKLGRAYKGLSIPVCKEAFNWNDNFMLKD